MNIIISCILFSQEITKLENFSKDTEGKKYGLVSIALVIVRMC